MDEGSTCFRILPTAVAVQQNCTEFLHIELWII